jgi:two-component system, sensor histidine kinase PdtaS
MKKILITYIIFLTLFVPSQAQDTPLNTIAKALGKATDFSFQNKDSALYLANYALKMAQSMDSTRLIFQSYRTLGLIYEDNNDLKSAQKTYKTALSLAESRLNEPEKWAIYTDWAIIHRKLGQYAITREFHLKTIQQAEKKANWVMVEDAYNGLGVLFAQLNDFDQAIHYHLLSIKAAEKSQNREGILVTNLNISDIYLKAKKLYMALKHIEKTYQDALILGDSLKIGAVLNSYGNIKQALGDYPDALKKQEAAKYIFEKQGNFQCLAESLLAIGDIYFQMKDYKKAEHFFTECNKFSDFFGTEYRADFCYKYGQLSQAQNQKNKALSYFIESLKLADSLGLKDISRKNHKALATIYAENKQNDLAYFHIKIADDLAETLIHDNKQEDVNQAQFKFDIEKRDLEIAHQKQALKQSQWAYGVFTLLCLALMILLYFTWKQVKAKQQAVKKAQLLLKELHHRVKNNMQTIASMMRLQARQSKDPSVTSVLVDNKLRLETFAMLNQQLYKRDINIETVDLGVFIKTMIDKLRFSNGISENDLKTIINVKNKELPVETALSVGLILNELLTNSMKYAYPSLEKKQPLVIEIHICKYQMQYMDNGKILKPDFDFNKKAGFGIKFIGSFVKQIRGKYQLYVDNGVHFDLTFPVQ